MSAEELAALVAKTFRDPFISSPDIDIDNRTFVCVTNCIGQRHSNCPA